MKTNTTIILNLRTKQKRQLRGMIATLTIVSDLGRCELATKIRAVRDALVRAILPGGTFDTIVEAKYLLTDTIGYANTVLGGDVTDCLGFVGNTLQELFDHYSNREG